MFGSMAAEPGLCVARVELLEDVLRSAKVSKIVASRHRMLSARDTSLAMISLK